MKNINRRAAEFVGGDAQIVGDARRRLARGAIGERDAVIDRVAEHRRDRHLLQRVGGVARVAAR